MTTMQNTQRHPDARFWDRMAARYSRKPVPDQAVYETKLDKTDAYLKNDDDVLEIGCGTGTTAIYHAPSVKQILATDIAPKMIDIARSKACAANVRNVRFEVSDIGKLGDRSEHFDVILAHSILHLVDDVDRVLRQLHRMLKPGGVLISSTNCIGDNAAFLRYVAPLGRALGLLPRINVFGEPEFERWIGEAGFVIEERWQPKPKGSIYLVARRGGNREEASR